MISAATAEYVDPVCHQTMRRRRSASSVSSATLTLSRGCTGSTATQVDEERVATQRSPPQTLTAIEDHDVDRQTERFFPVDKIARDGTAGVAPRRAQDRRVMRPSTTTNAARQPRIDGPAAIKLDFRTITISAPGTDAARESVAPSPPTGSSSKPSCYLVSLDLDPAATARTAGLLPPSLGMPT